VCRCAAGPERLIATGPNPLYTTHRTDEIFLMTEPESREWWEVGYTNIVIGVPMKIQQ
jgi:hypothetical protein